MENLNISYSLKNIPCPSKKSYIKALISKTENFLKRLRWKAYFFDNPKPDQNVIQDNKYGFKTLNTPPANQNLSNFEEDMIELITNIKYTSTNCSFQNKMNMDCEKVKNSGNVVVEADKTHNLYLLEPKDYNKLIFENITQSYQKCDPNEKCKIDEKSAQIAQKFKIEDRVQQFTTDECFLTIKDHKPNFPNSIKCRLINPAKNQLGKVSQQILRKIIDNLTSKLELNMWKNTDNVIDWFTVADNANARLIKFDIVDFYPSINEELLNKALAFAKSHVPISEDDLQLINHTKSSLLFDGKSTWKKKSGAFDVTMGSYDGAECCEIVGIYLLNKLSKNNAT